VTDLKDPAAVVALAAASLALLALIATLVLATRLRRVRAAQSAVLGPSGRDDLVAHAAALQRAFEATRDEVRAAVERLDDRTAAVEQRLDGAIAHRALVRYDAYGELAGKQSISLALLDAHHNGVVLSSIAHRDTARLYCKPVSGGSGEQPLSPEEQEAVRLALAGGPQSVTLET
jgi:hypothetical protein